MKAGDAAVGLVACGTAWAVYLTKTRVDPFSRRPFATVLEEEEEEEEEEDTCVVDGAVESGKRRVVRDERRIGVHSRTNRRPDGERDERTRTTTVIKKTTIVTTIKMTSRIERRTSEETEISVSVYAGWIRVCYLGFIYQRIRV